MNITLCSTDIVWEDKKANFSAIESLLENISPLGDLVVLPEMYSTGFTMNTELAESMAGESVTFLQKCAEKYQCAFLASIPIKIENAEGVKYYNRAFFVFPDGKYECYDKRHLFSMVKENSYYTAGEEQKIIEYKGVRISLNICYDLRFPVWSRNVENQYDLLINVANFPEPRYSVIEPLIKARAIENLSYAIFVNRVGYDPLCKYIQSSYFIDYKGAIAGEYISLGQLDTDIQVIRCNIDMAKLKNFREKFPAWKDADKFTINK